MKSPFSLFRTGRQPILSTSRKLAIEALEDRTLLAVTVVTSVADSDVLFETDDQSMWAQGAGDIISKDFELDLIDINIPSTTIGGFIGLPNPLRPIYDAAFEACLGFGPCEDLLGSRPSATLGDTGAKLTFEQGKINFGLQGGVEINPGQVDVDYETDLSLSASDAVGIRAGDMFTINTSQLAGPAFMTTDSPDITAFLGTFADVDVKADLAIKFLDASIFDGTLFDFDTAGKVDFEIIRLTIGQSSGIDVTLFETVEVTLAEEGIDLPIPEPANDFFGATIFIPELDTAPPDTSTFSGGKITNTKLDSLTPANTGETDIDFLRIQFDLDAILTTVITGGAFTDGFGVEIDLGSAGSFELFLMDANLQGFFGIGQTFMFTPNLKVDLVFSQPTMVETSPGSGVFSQVSTKRVTVGDQIQAKHPGGDLTIDPDYTVADNTFENDTDIRFRPNLNLRFLGYNVGGAVGVAFDALGIPRADQVHFVNLGADPPLKLADIFNSSFTMLGFNTEDGSDLILPALEPPELTLNPVTAINEDAIATLSGTITDANAGDFFSLDITWDDGNTQTINFPDPDDLSPDPLPAGVTWNAETGAFTVEHQYLDDGLTPGGIPQHTYTVSAEATDSTNEMSGQEQTTVLVNNVNPSVMLNSTAAIDENGTATLTGMFTDPGTLDTFTLVVDWDDPNNGADSTFAFGTISSLNTGDTINSSTDSAVLTLTDVDAANDKVSYSVQHQYLDDGPDPGNGTVEDTSTIEVTVTDDDTGVGTDEESQVVQNVVPVIDLGSVVISATQGNKAVVGDVITLSASFTDVGILDAHSVHIDWDDGETDDTSISLANFTSFDDGDGDGAGSFTAEHVYDTEGGIFEIIITVTDDDTGQATTTTLAWVSGVRISSEGILQVVGTSGDDHVTINQQGNGKMKVHADFLHSGSFKTFSSAEALTIEKIIAYLCEGDDHLNIAGNVDLPAIIHAGAGNDHINSGGGPSVLLGEAGDDTLIGGFGRNILIGGLGLDDLVGGNDEDVLIGGRLVNDDDDELMAALAVWAVEEDSHVDRVTALNDLITVLDDGEEDDLAGGAGRDLYFEGLGDDLNGVTKFDTVL